MKHTITINRTTKHNIKPTDIKKESFNCKEQLEVTISEFSQLVTQPNGYTWCPAIFKDNKRSNSNWISQSVFALDFDSGISISDVICKLQSEGLNPNIVYTSFSDTSALRKFRVVLFFNRVIDDAVEAKLIGLKLMYLFDESVDISCKDYARMFFGGKELVMISEELNDLSVVEKLETPIFINTNSLSKHKTVKESNVINNQFEQVECNGWNLLMLEQSNLFKRFKNGDWLYHNELFALATNLYWITTNGRSLIYKMKATMEYWNSQGKTQYTENNFNIINSQLSNKYSPMSLNKIDKHEQYTNLLVLLQSETRMYNDKNKLNKVQNTTSTKYDDTTLVLDNTKNKKYNNVQDAINSFF